jgi:opacity protein-like surface antigen
MPGHSHDHRRRSPRKAFVVFLFLATVAPNKAIAADRGGKWDLGLDGGYVATSRSDRFLPHNVHGGTVGLGLRYEFNASWFLGLEGRLDLHPSYRLRFPLLSEVESESSGEPQEAPPRPQPTVEQFRLASLAAGVGYYIDVYRLVPYMGLWLVGLQVSQKTSFLRTEEGQEPTRMVIEQRGYDLGARLGLGVDYDISDFMTVGASFGYDWFFTRATSYGGRMSLLARFGMRLGSPSPKPSKNL